MHSAGLPKKCEEPEIEREQKAQRALGAEELQAGLAGGQGQDLSGAGADRQPKEKEEDRGSTSRQKAGAGLAGWDRQHHSEESTTC